MASPTGVEGSLGSGADRRLHVLAALLACRIPAGASRHRERRHVRVSHLLEFTQELELEWRYVAPGKPTQNAFAELSGRMRDECLNEHLWRFTALSVNPVRAIRPPDLGHLFGKFQRVVWFRDHCIRTDLEV
jgi:hypothetical protein